MIRMHQRFKALRSLELQPGAGQIETELEWLNMGHRRIFIERFKIIYYIKDDMIIVNDIHDIAMI